MSLKHAWLILQMVPLVLSAPTATDKVPTLRRLSPTASRDVIGANLWNWKTSVTSPREEDIKPRPLQRHLSGSGGTTAAMSLKHAWLILQMVPLVLSAPTATDKVPALPGLSPTASRDVIWANLWNWKTSVTSPREEDIKPRPLQRHLSGSGGTTAAMSLKHAWLILQMVPLVLSAPTATDKVPTLRRLSPTASRDVIGANLWNWKTSGDVTTRRRHKTSSASAAPQWERRHYSSNVAETCVAYLADRRVCSRVAMIWWAGSVIGNAAVAAGGATEAVGTAGRPPGTIATGWATRVAAVAGGASGTAVAAGEAIGAAVPVDCCQWSGWR
ncbi:hypothetical protein MRX96_028055 [Rhipicephalus microplus]